MAKLGSGNVELTLGDDSLTLKPTLSAMQRISRQYGGLREALARIQALDFEALVFVVTVGAGLKGDEAKDLPDKVFKATVAEVTASAVDFIVVLLNGGRPVDDAPADEDASGNE